MILTKMQKCRALFSGMPLSPGRTLGKLALLLAVAVVMSLGLSGAAQAERRVGDFDYYVLSLSWSPTWCRTIGDHRDAPQCDTNRDLDFTLHGLWPQYEHGWPRDCPSQTKNPSRRDSAGMEDIMGSGGLAWYQWKKLGRCSGLSGRDYYALSRRAFDKIQIPKAFDLLDRDIRLSPDLIEAAFIDANPDLDPDGITVTCKGPALQEVRICLTRDLEPRICAPDSRVDCARPAILMEQPR